MTSFKLLLAVRTDTDFIPPDLWYLNSPDLNPADYSLWSIMQEKVYQTHIAIRWVETSASSGVGGAGPETYRCSYRQQRRRLNACDSCV